MTVIPFPVKSDEAARQRIRHSLHESLIVEASAGTGKTTELIARIKSVLAEGLTTVDRIVAVTFTHKAAGELKIRLRQELDKGRAAASDQARDRLEQALEQLEEASIGTIHGFCAQILRARPVEARVDPAFEELTEQEAARLYDRAFKAWFAEQLDKDSPGLRRALARLAWRDSWESGPAVDQLKSAGWNLIQWRDFTALWSNPEYDRNRAVDELLAQARGLWSAAATCTRASDPLLKCLSPLRDMLAWIERGRVRDYDTLEAVLLKLGRDIAPSKLRKGRGAYATGVDREMLHGDCLSLIQSIGRFREASGVSLACELQSEMQGLLARYEKLKQSTGKLDFLDLLLLARDLMQRDRSVRQYFQERFTHIFVDEFQDTDPLQAAILLLLSADDPAETDWLKVSPVAGKLFVVGDPKQSIYKFRRADVVLYQRICAALESTGVGRVSLTKSYRSVRELQQFVNAAFAAEMTGDAELGHTSYSPIDEDGPATASQPAVIALPVPLPPNGDRITKGAIDACLPDAIAAFIDWLVRESGLQVRDSGEWKPLRARHVCVLFRRFINFGTDLTRAYVHALEARGIPHLLVGSKSFHHREEVEAIRTALTAIEWPEDELAVFALLRGSLFAFSDDLLFRFKHEYRRLHPFRRYPAELVEEFRPIAAALDKIAELHRLRNRRAIADTINLLLEHVRAHAGFALRPSGQQVLANVLRISDLARAYELTGGFSFRGFIEELNAQAEKTESPEAPVLEEASDGVRIMTVHAAKGLEFPVVVLADMTANLAAREADRYVDAERDLCATRLLRHCSPRELCDHAAREIERERAEGVRVCYVAATRARDLLVVPAVGDAPFEGWLAPLNKALYTVRNAQSVVRWHSSRLRLNVNQDHGLRDVDVLKAGGKGEESLAAYRDWRDHRARTIDGSARPEFDIAQVTGILNEPPEHSVSFASVSAVEPRPTGRRFGTLVHAVLRDVPPAATKEEIEALTAMHARIVSADAGETSAASLAVAAVLDHEIWRAASTSSNMHRELPVTLNLGEGRLLEGVLDLAYRDTNGWVVVDYKTDDSNQEIYIRQLRWYLHALSLAKGAPARGILLQV